MFSQFHLVERSQHVLKIQRILHLRQYLRELSSFDVLELEFRHERFTMRCVDVSQQGTSFVFFLWFATIVSVPFGS
ncbi:hypothetical protein EUGRSUZ_J02355 [Eucalyptus grandis]|uniref:Uncharacterized protein n=2 Tax=Eucalyptus grandis TaxID=71139 RepID=A0ACC3J7X9_EUCGR|nr:hypothetical protein EUGRSUZ_J02355 [Eucalyptus grandis]